MSRLDNEIQGLWEEKRKSEKLDPIDDEDFVPAKEVKESKPEDVLIHVDL
jgi:hypothetical protein